MCFSAVASFTASGVLTAAGVLSIRQAKTKKQLPFAAIPFLFAFQQFVEGFVWLSLTDPTYAGLQDISKYTFLIFAQVVWPFIVPYSIYLLEKDETRKRIFIPFIVIGGAVSAFLAFCMVAFPVQASVEMHHIRYDLNLPWYNINYKGIPYALATVIPAFISSVRGMKIFGATILFSLLVTELFFQEYVVSVWCFFAAIMSATIVLVYRKMNGVRAK